MADAIELQNRGLTCTIVPGFGASVTRLDFEKRSKTYHVLQPTAPEALVPGCDPRLFSLAHVMPVGGPIRHNKFRWEGKDKLLQPNIPGIPTFYNGNAWQRPWEGKKEGKNAATCRFTHKADDVWPFSYSVVAIFDLEEDNLSVTYEVASEMKQGVMPLGFGSTMLFPKPHGTSISSSVSSMWHQDDELVPTTNGDAPFNLDLKEGLQLDALDTHERWYSGWVGKASIDYTESKLSVMVKAYGEYPHLGFESHKNQNTFRLTALTHVPGILDLKGYDEDETGYQVLGPGESTSAKLKVDVDLSLY